jgi:hypothetical protein
VSPCLYPVVSCLSLSCLILSCLASSFPLFCLSCFRDARSLAGRWTVCVQRVQQGPTELTSEFDNNNKEDTRTICIYVIFIFVFFCFMSSYQGTFKAEQVEAQLRRFSVALSLSLPLSLPLSSHLSLPLSLHFCLYIFLCLYYLVVLSYLAFYCLRRYLCLVVLVSCLALHYRSKTVQDDLDLEGSGAISHV